MSRLTSYFALCDVFYEGRAKKAREREELAEKIKKQLDRIEKMLKDDVKQKTETKLTYKIKLKQGNVQKFGSFVLYVPDTEASIVDEYVKELIKEKKIKIFIYA